MDTRRLLTGAGPLQGPGLRGAAQRGAAALLERGPAAGENGRATGGRYRSACRDAAGAPGQKRAGTLAGVRRGGGEALDRYLRVRERQPGAEDLALWLGLVGPWAERGAVDRAGS